MSESDEHNGPSDESPGPSQDDPTTVIDRRRRRRWWPFIVAGVLVLAVAGAAIYWELRPKSDAATSTQFVSVSQQTLKKTVSATGTIEPAQESDLSFSSSGTVTAVNVEVGDRVSKGEVLATMDDSSLRAAVESDKAALEASQEDLTTLEDDSSATATALSSAKADVKLKKSELAQAREALKSAKLKAPFSGVVADVGISVGDAAAGSGSSNSSSSSSSSGSSASGSGSGGALGSGTSSAASTQDGSSSSGSSDSGSITVISTNSWTVSSSVGGTDLASVKKGLQAQITPSGATDPVFGTVQTVGVMASSSDSGTSSFPVTIKITGSPADLHAGESADVSIIVKQITDAIVVPTLAVKTVNNQTVVEKKSGTKTIQTKITIGDTYGAYTQVKSGLAVGDQVQVSLPGEVRSGAGTSRGTNSGQGPYGGIPGGGGFGGGGFPRDGTGSGFGGGNR